ncbi:MAG: CoA-binding protein [Thermodesulfobacteriota bacterium]
MVTIPELLAFARRIAVVGLSPKPERPSHQVARYLLAAGFEVIPVNPGLAFVLDRPCYPSLAAVPGPVDIVDIFRRPEEVPALVREAIRIGARAVWMQQGIVHAAAAAEARAAGLMVVMDRCLKVEHQRLAAGILPGLGPA